MALEEAGVMPGCTTHHFCPSTVVTKGKLAAYKYPRIIEIIDDLPKTVTGKILRRELRK